MLLTSDILWRGLPPFFGNSCLVTLYADERRRISSLRRIRYSTDSIIQIIKEDGSSLDVRVDGLVGATKTFGYFAMILRENDFEYNEGN